MNNDHNTDKKAIPGLSPIPVGIEQLDLEKGRDLEWNLYEFDFSSYNEGPFSSGLHQIDQIDHQIHLATACIHGLLSAIVYMDSALFDANCISMLEKAMDTVDEHTYYDATVGFVLETGVCEFFSDIPMPIAVFACIMMYAMSGHKTRRFIRRRIRDIINPNRSGTKKINKDRKDPK